MQWMQKRRQEWAAGLALDHKEDVVLVGWLAHVYVTSGAALADRRLAGTLKHEWLQMQCDAWVQAQRRRRRVHEAAISGGGDGPVMPLPSDNKLASAYKLEWLRQKRLETKLAKARSIRDCSGKGGLADRRTSVPDAEDEWEEAVVRTQRHEWERVVQHRRAFDLSERTVPEKQVLQAPWLASLLDAMVVAGVVPAACGADPAIRANRSFTLDLIKAHLMHHAGLGLKKEKETPCGHDVPT